MESLTMKQRMILITDCNIKDAIGLWYCNNYSSLIDKVSNTFQQEITHCSFTHNTLHSLTSYL